MDQPKNTLLAITVSLAAGGAERSLVTILNYLVNHNQPVHLIILEDQLDLVHQLDKRIIMNCLNKQSLLDFIRLVWKLKQIIKEEQPRVILSVLHYANIVVTLAKWLARNSGRLIISEHTYTHHYLKRNLMNRLKHLLMKWLYPKADHVVAVSRGIKTYIEQTYHLSDKKVSVIYNPLALHDIEIGASQLIEHPFFNHRKKVILGVGRLAQEKRFDRLIKVFAKLKEKDPSYRLIILGEGSKLYQLQTLAASLGITNELDFIGFQNNPYAWMRQADLLVLTSEREGLPNVILEAMACHLPVVAVDCQTGPSEIIISGKNGLLVPEGNEQALIKAIRELTNNQDMINQFKQEGEKLVQSYSIEKIMPTYRQLLSGYHKGNNHD